MGDIKAFLLPPVMEETKEAVITKRAKGPDGKPVPFVLRAIDQETNDKLIRRAQRTNKVNGQTVRELDTEKYGKLLISACVVEPNFKDAQMCAYYKTVDPLDSGRTGNGTDTERGRSDPAGSIETLDLCPGFRYNGSPAVFLYVLSP